MVAEFFAGPLQDYLAHEDVTEVLMNRPGEVWTESSRGWQCHAVSALDMPHLMHMAEAIAAYRNATLDAEHPLLSVGLPGGERAQFAIYPVVPEGTFSLTIRRPSRHVATLDELDGQGLFRFIEPDTGRLSEHDQRLLELKEAGRFMEFLRLAVALRKTIVISGQTGAGKTYVLKTLCDLIDPGERIVTIESVPELLLPRHVNAVHLFYTDNDQGHAQISPRQLLKAALRMRPDRIMLAEVRDEECFFFVRSAASGHPGSMTTLHAGSTEEAFAQMALMIRQSPGGAGLAFSEIDRLLRMTVDVVVQFGNDPAKGRHISGLYYEPQRRMRAAVGEQS